MTTTGTYAFNPGLGELTIYAFQLAGVRPTEITQEHMVTARMAANMVQSRWSAQGVNLWAVDLQTISLSQGVGTYSVPADTVAILDGYIVQAPSGPNRYLLPISRSEYASYPNPTQQGQPTVYWFDRLLAPTLTLWFVPDGNEVSFNYYRVRQIQDASLTGNLSVEVPYYFLEAYANAVAQRLATIWKPERAQGLKLLADESYQIAIDQNVETANLYVSPIVAGYWRA